MKPSRPILVLTAITAVLAIFAATAGLSIRGGQGSTAFTTIWNQQAVLLGEGLYKHDTRFFGAGFRGQDIVALFLGVPLLIGAAFLYARAMHVGHLLLVGALGYFLYLYASAMVTYALDLGIITPATFVCAALVLRRRPLGYVIAMPLLTLLILLAPQIALSTLFQRAAGVPLTIGEMIGPVAGFVILGLISLRMLIAVLKGVASPA